MRFTLFVKKKNYNPRQREKNRSEKLSIAVKGRKKVFFVIRKNVSENALAIVIGSVGK